MKERFKTKKIVATILSLVIIFQYVSMIVPFLELKSVALTTTVDGIEWTYSDYGSGYAYSVKPSNKDSISGAVTIPEILDGHTVRTMGYNAFQGCTNLTQVTLPNTITNIGYRAFLNCTNLTTINIPSSVTNIETQAFEKCSKLSNITIPESVINIGQRAFYGCSSLTEIKIPNGVSRIQDGCFYGCTNLVSLELPDSLTVIERYSIYNCLKLTSFTIPKNVTTIGEGALGYCKSLKNVTIPNSVTTIENYIFRSCTGLSNINISNSTISLVNCEIPTTTNINCVDPNGISWTYSIESNNNSIKIKPTDKTQLPANVTIPSQLNGFDVTAINDNAFLDCTGLTEVIIPNGVTSIGKWAFSYCYELTNITIPESVTNIGEYAFYWCGKLTNITIPEGVTNIGKGAFYGCSKLAEIEIPGSVTNIEEKSFDSCTALKNVTIQDGVTNIGKGAFYGCSKLAEIEIPGSVTNIEEQSFYSCTALKNVTIQDGVTSIGNEAFSSYNMNIDIPKSVTSIADNAIPDSATIYGYVDSYAYEYAINNNIKFMPYGFTTTEGIITTVDGIEWVFDYSNGKAINVRPKDKNLLSGTITIPEKLEGIVVTDLNSEAFSSNTEIEKIIIPNGITSIKDSQFYRCTGLKEVEIPNSVTSIGGFAFYNCSPSRIEFGEGENIVTIKSDAFKKSKNDISTTYVILPNDKIIIYSSNFNGFRDDNMPGKYPFVLVCNPNSKAENFIKENYNRFTEYYHESYTDGAYSYINPINTTVNGIEYEYNVLSGIVSDIEVKSDLTNISEIEIPNEFQLGNRTYPANTIDNIFANENESITKIILSNGIAEIKKDAFNNCKNLEEIVIPKSVTKIGEENDDDIFYNNDNVTINCIEGSYAHEYAIRKGIKCFVKREIIFNDENLYSKIKDILGDKVVEYNNETKTIYVQVEEVDQITDLDISNAEIHDLTALEQFKNLEKLNANSNKIVNFNDDMFKFLKLKELDLSNNELEIVDNTDKLVFNNSNLPSLEKLNLSNTNLYDEDIENIACLENLTELNIDNNHLRNVSVVSGIENLTAKKQNIVDNIYKKEIQYEEIPQIIKDAIQNNKTISAINCVITDNKVIIDDDINGIQNDEMECAKIVIQDGITQGTTYILNIANDIKIEYEQNNDELKIITKKESDSSNLYNANIRYCIDDSTEIKTYENEISMLEGTHIYHIKIFNKELSQKEINVTYNLRAIRKNGEIYIYTNYMSSKKYSFEENGEYFDYDNPINNQDKKYLYVKLGESDPRLVNIEDITSYSEEQYTIYDEQEGRCLTFKNQIGDNYVDVYDEVYAIRQNGKIIISNDQDFAPNPAYFQFGNYYSYDCRNWHKYDEEGIEDIGSKYIYIAEKSTYYMRNIYRMVILNNIDDYEQIHGIVKEKNNNYDFSIRTVKPYSDLYGKKENKISILEKSIAGMTNYKGDIIVLSEDGIMYKYTRDNEYVKISDETNFKQISGPYLLDNQNKIYKYSVENNLIVYNICTEFDIQSKIEKLKYTVYDNEILPYVLYKNGIASILRKDFTNDIMGYNVLDIAENDNLMGNYKEKIIQIGCSSNLPEDEIPIKINKYGKVLTNKGNIYTFSINDEDYITYTLETSNVKRLGDYSYETEDNQIIYQYGNSKYDLGLQRYYHDIEETYYASFGSQDIIIEKDETNIVQNEVKIKITVPENKYKVKLPNGSEIASSITYSVNKNGAYKFVITNEDGYQVVKTIHVTNIQDRSEELVPQVSVASEMIKLSSNYKIQYSIDEKNWTEYTEEIKYEDPIYARIVNNEFVGKTIKIVLDDNGKLEIEKTDDRKIKINTLNNSIGGEYGAETNLTLSKENVLKIAIEVAHLVAETVTETQKNFFTYVSEISQNIIYNISAVDGKYAGCYTTPARTEITYKDIDSDILTIDKETSIKQKEENSSLNIDYAVVKNTYISSNNGRNNVEQEEKEYEYIDTEGKIEGNIDIINRFKEVLGDTYKYSKILGDGNSYLMLTQDGELYFVGGKEYYVGGLGLKREPRIIIKLKTDIVDILDYGLAVDKNGKTISLTSQNPEEESVVKSISSQTDKYLVYTHLGLKDGKLYDFTDVRNGTEVKRGKLKIVDNKEDSIGYYSESEGTLTFGNGEKNNDNEQYFTAEEIEGELPQFADIAEFRNGGVFGNGKLGVGGYEINSDEIANKYTKCIAVTTKGEIYAYINGYAVDTGINLDYFGPIASYEIDNTNWTNEKITANLNTITANEIVQAKIEKESTNNRRMLLARGANIPGEDGQKEIETNGTYKYTVTDAKGRTFTGTFNVSNIDKLKPQTPVIEQQGKKLKIDFKDDQEATSDYAKSGIAKRLISYDNENWEEVEENETLLSVPKDVLVYAKTIDNAGNESEIASGSARAIIGKVIVKYEDLDGNELKESKLLSGEEDQEYSIEKETIEGYEFKESDKPLTGTYTEEDQIIILKYKKIEIPEPDLEPEPQPDPEPEPQPDPDPEPEPVIEPEKEPEPKPETGKVIILYQDKEEKEIEKSESLTGIVGTDYKVERKEIKGYKLMQILGDEEGKFKKDDQFVIYKYEKIEEQKPEPEKKPIEEKKDEPKEEVKIEIKTEELPKTGQSRILYISIAIIIIIAAGVVIYFKIKGKNNKDK